MNRKDFSILNQDVSYLDHAASSLTPDYVVDAMSDYYHRYRSNVHRGVYQWSAQATIAYEQAREQVAQFVGSSPNHLILTSGTTESIHLAAHGYLAQHIRPGQVIILTPLEHHSNMVPWQRLAQTLNCKLEYVKLLPNFEIDWGNLEQIIDQHDVAMIALTHASNVIGVKNDVFRASKYNIPVLVDGTQVVSHEPINVVNLGCAFYAFSAHKMYGPTGIGALYVHPDYLEKMTPVITGGGMVSKVSPFHAEYKSGVQGYEAGTPNIAGAIGFSAACRYISNIGFDLIQKHERAVMDHLCQILSPLSINSFGPHQHMVYAFDYPDVHAHDVATILSDDQVMVRAGHHCCMPLMKQLGVSALTRASIGLYNTIEDIDRLKSSLRKVSEVMQV